MSDSKSRTIEILSTHYEEIEKIVAQSTQFQTVSDYVNFVLQELLFEGGDSDNSDVEEAALKKRFKDLGYL